MTDAGKQRYDADQAWDLLKDAASVTVAKGKKFARFVPAEDGREAVLKGAMGPSGNLRAPTYRVGRDYVIGFNPELYEGWVK